MSANFLMRLHLYYLATAFYHLRAKLLCLERLWLSR